MDRDGSGDDVNVSPDGQRYLAMTGGGRVAIPFHLRWLVPALCGLDGRRWIGMTFGSLVAIAGLSTWFVGLSGASGWQLAAVPFLVSGLPGIVKINARFPILVDAPAIALALLAACLCAIGWWPAAIVVAIVAGMAKETAPLWAAIFAWNPILLVGLVAPLIRRLLVAPGADVLDEHNAWVLKHPFAASWRYHKDRLTDPRLWVTPWGVLLVGLVAFDLQLAVALAVGYGLTLVATDTVRIYQWAFPVLLVAALTVVPDELLVLAVIAHLFNPWGGDGL